MLADTYEHAGVDRDHAAAAAARVPELPNLVHDLGLDDLIEDVITSAATGYEKPHPQMFSNAIDRAGSPDQVWMIGDSTPYR